MFDLFALIGVNGYVVQAQPHFVQRDPRFVPARNTRFRRREMLYVKTDIRHAAVRYVCVQREGRIGIRIPALLRRRLLVRLYVSRRLVKVEQFRPNIPVRADRHFQVGTQLIGCVVPVHAAGMPAACRKRNISAREHFPFVRRQRIQNAPVSAAHRRPPGRSRHRAVLRISVEHKIAYFPHALSGPYSGKIIR